MKRRFGVSANETVLLLLDNRWEKDCQENEMLSPKWVYLQH